MEYYYVNKDNLILEVTSISTDKKGETEVNSTAYNRNKAELWNISSRSTRDTVSTIREQVEEMLNTSSDSTFISLLAATNLNDAINELEKDGVFK